MRDDIFVKTKGLPAKRVVNRCSNPGCRQPTSGPQEHPTKVVNIGVAAHITAASPNITFSHHKAEAFLEVAIGGAPKAASDS